MSYLVPPKSVAKKINVTPKSVLRVTEVHTPDMAPGARTYLLCTLSGEDKGSVPSVSGWKMGKRPTP